MTGMWRPCPDHDAKDLFALPQVWEARLEALRNNGRSPQQQLRTIEFEGAPAEILALAISRLYDHEPGLRCWCGSIPDSGPGGLARSSWAVATLACPEPVLACLGHSLLDVFAYRVATLPVKRWFEGPVHRGVDPEVLLAATMNGLTFRSPLGALDLTWIRKEVQGCLEILAPKGSLTLPPLLQCRGRFEVRGAAGITRLQGIRVVGTPGTAIIDGCPDLEDLELPRATRVEVRNCAALKRIRGHVPPGGLEVVGCAKLEDAVLSISRDTLVRPDLTFRDCPSLVRLGSMNRTRRVIGNLTLAGCPSLQGPLPPLVVMGRLNVPPPTPAQPQDYHD